MYRCCNNSCGCGNWQMNDWQMGSNLMNVNSMNNCPKNSSLETVCDDVSDCGCGCSCENSCGCGFDEDEDEGVFPLNPLLGQSYVPVQRLTETFTPCCGLKNGTIFPELVSPYYPCQSVEDIEYLKRRNTIGEGCNTCS